MTVFVNLIRCPDCGALTFDPRDRRCSVPCPYCDDQSESGVKGCIAGGCDKDPCRTWANAELNGEELRERLER